MEYGNSFLILYLGKFILFGGLPLLTLILVSRSIREERRTGNKRLALSDYASFIVSGFLYAVLIVLTIGLLLGVLLIITER